MINEKLLDIACEQFRNDIKDTVIFTIADLPKAVLAGCNAVTNKQHDKAQEIVDEYISYKDKDLVYTEGDMVRAFEAGCRIMSAVVDEEKRKVRLSMLVPRQNLQKAMKLISAGQQMMDLASIFCDEASNCLSKQGHYRTGIRNDFGKLRNILRNINSQVKGAFIKFSPDESFDWADDADKLEEAVRDIFKIDVFEEMDFNTNN
jgi:hypothetical protein